MEVKPTQTQNAKRTAIKVGLVALISLLLLIPLIMVYEVIDDRKHTKDAVVEEVANSYAHNQIINAPYLVSYSVEDLAEDKKIELTDEEILAEIHGAHTHCSQVDYTAEIETDMLHRSIYDVIVYNSKVKVSGKLPITEETITAAERKFCFEVGDIKGFSNPSQLTFGGQSFELGTEYNELVAKVAIPNDAKAGDVIDFAITFDLKGTESLFFNPTEDGNTTVAISSSYPHPSFQGAMLPNTREVKEDGFKATWSVSSFNSSSYDDMGVEFVDPANPYQQSMRSAKYGMLIIVLVFAAGLLVEFLTRKEINPIQYVIIGLSLVLFYSLLVAFSEFITFGVAYVIAALMTTLALMFYFRAILKSCSAYMLGGFVALVYALNYMLLQMETYALLAGSIVLFLLLCVVMYLTANINNKKELAKTE